MQLRLVDKLRYLLYSGHKLSSPSKHDQTEIEDELKRLQPQEARLFWSWARWMLYATGFGVAISVGAFVADKVVSRTTANVVLIVFLLAAAGSLVRMGILMWRWLPYGTRRSRLIAEKRRAGQ